ncbi:HIRAN domain-containing protein [Oerskovia flava]|uniref:HIRAN domain-containing protein n=1 Tax=Oerskovia flava TaxID=2986422 RepID=UPI003CCD6DF1
MRNPSSSPDAIRPRKLEPSALHVIDLSDLDSLRLRITGTAYCVTDDERRRYGGTEYLLVCEPDNETDSSAVAVYGRGSRVGYLPRARAASICPVTLMDADAFRVSGAGSGIENGHPTHEARLLRTRLDRGRPGPASVARLAAQAVARPGQSSRP